MKALALLLCIATVLSANPKGSSVVHGNAQLMESENRLEIETSERSIINWDSFSINAQETTQFVQPSIDSAVLNRVMGADISQLMGKLEANGRVYLVNPNGVVIGEQGRVDTAAFIASVLDIQNGEFINGESLSFEGLSLGEIINLGTIETTSGPISLIGHRIENSGDLIAPEGTVSLTSGHSLLLDPTGDALIYIHPDLKADGVDNAGRIEAFKTQIQTDCSPTSLAIGLGGIIEANSIEEVGGEIYLTAGAGDIEIASEGSLFVGNEGQIIVHAETGTVELKGEIEAPSGEVHLLGERIHVLDDAQIDVAGNFGGGTVLIGGGYKGENPDIPNSDVVFFDQNSIINADAIDDGDGGKVILWGNLSNGFFGNISAQGGPNGGDGGFVEISSHGGLAYNGLVKTLAPKGKSGMLLLDPTDVTISSAADTNVTPGATYLYTGSPVNVNTTTLEANLALGNVFVLTSSAVDQAEPGTLTVSSPINVTANELFLFSNTVTNINAPITVTGSADLHIFATTNLFINSAINWQTSNFFVCNSSVNTTISSTGSINCTSGVDVNVVSMADLFVEGSISTNGAGLLTLTAFGAASDLFLDGCTLTSQTAMSFSPTLTLSLIGGSTININTPGMVTLTSSTSTVNTRAGLLPVNLNTTASTLSFPIGVTQGGPDTININNTGGNVSFGGTVGPPAAATFNVNVAATGNVDFSGALDQPGGGTLNVDATAGGNVNFGSTVFANSLTVDATGSVTFGAANANILTSSVNAGGSISLNGMFDGGSLNFSAGGDINISSNPVDMALGALTMTAGNNVNIAAGANIQVEFASFDDLTLQAGNNILIGDGLFMQGANAVFLIAGNNITAAGTGQIRTIRTEDITLVTDNNNPNPPDFGTGKFTIPNGFTFETNFGSGLNKTLLFTALPGESTFPSVINGAAYTPGTFGESQYNPGTNELVGFWYLTRPPPDPPLFQIMYKATGIINPAVVQTIEVAVTEPVSNPPQITQVTEGNLSVPSKPDPKTPCRTPPVAVQAL